MHRLPNKGDIPDVLRKLCRNNPECRDWNSFRDNQHESYIALKKAIFAQQSYLCAYCECNIDSTRPDEQRIEHFHPKSDTASSHNWAFDWNNLLGVCLGGTKQESDISPHCDAAKEKDVNAREGRILNPLTMPESCVFELDRKNGYLIPNESFCRTQSIPDNPFHTTEELIKNTIDVLNLNCTALANIRKKIILEYDKKRHFLQSSHKTKESVRTTIARQWFKKPLQFYTTRRILLGRYAEEIIREQRESGN